MIEKKSLECRKKHLEVWEDSCVKKVGKIEFYETFHQDNEGADLERHCD